MKATKYTNKELVEIYKNLKTSAKILGFSSANDSEMIAEIELEAIKRHLNLVDGTVEETVERQKGEVITMKAKTYKAAVTNKETGKLEVITRDDYTSKKDFAHDLRVNGYAVRFISTPEKFDEDCEKYHWELERRKNVREAMKQHKASKEQDEQEVQEAVDQTEVEETAEIETAKPETAETDDSGFEYYSVETAYEVDFRDRQNEVFKTYSEAEKTAGDNIILEVDLIVRNDKKAVCEHDKEVFEDETDEIECRCIWYHHNGVKGMIAQDTKRVIKKPETAEVSKEVVDNRKEVNSTNFIQQLYDAEYSKTLTVQGGIERFLKLAKEFVKNKSAEMSLIVDTAAQVLHDKYKLDYGTIETLEIEAYNS